MNKGVEKSVATLQQEVKELTDALERAEIKLAQYKQKDIFSALHISQLESIVILVRNAVTPRGQRVFAEDLTKEKADGVQIG